MNSGTIESTQASMRSRFFWYFTVAAMMASGAAAAFTATDYTDRRLRITRTGLGQGSHGPV